MNRATIFCADSRLDTEAHAEAGPTGEGRVINRLGKPLFEGAIETQEHGKYDRPIVLSFAFLIARPTV
jgi:hypothetical protein